MKTNEMIDNANQMLKAGCFDDAVEAYTKVIEQCPTTAEAFCGRAQAYFQLKNWNEALSNFSRARELDSKNLESWTGLAVSLAMNNKIYEAIDVFQICLTDHPGYVRGHFQLGLLYYQLGIINQGHEQMNKALSCRPTLAERRLIEQIHKKQKTLDKKRFYRPDFEALRGNSIYSPGGWMLMIKNLYRSLTRSRV